MEPTEEDEAEFAKELAKMVTDSSAESRKVDRRTAQVLWDSAVLPTSLRKKMQDDGEHEEGDEATVDPEGMDTMKFVMLSKKGNKQQVGRGLRSSECYMKLLSFRQRKLPFPQPQL